MPTTLTHPTRTPHAAAARAHRSLELRRQLLAIRADDTTSRHVLVDDAVARGAHDEAVAMVRTELAMHPTNPATMNWASGIYDALSMETEAVDDGGDQRAEDGAASNSPTSQCLKHRRFISKARIHTPGSGWPAPRFPGPRGVERNDRLSIARDLRRGTAISGD